MKRQQELGHARYGVLASTISVILLGAGLNGVSHAQEQQEGQRAQSALEEVTVTGSRIRRDDFSSPQPTTVVSSEYLNNLGIINLGDAMVQMPSNVSTNTPTAAPGGNFFNGSTIANLRGLNPFFGSRTLTLVDSRRHVPTNQGDGVDLNFIPTVLIDRMEVVTGGASASYGSGAIGGVTNILLDRNLDGFRAEVDFGQTAEGDGDDSHYGFAFGTPIGERGHFVIGIEGQKMDPIENCGRARDWCGKAVGVEDDHFSPAAPGGVPENVITGGLTSAWQSWNGIFWIPGYQGRTPNSGTPVPLELNAAGTGLQTYNPGRSGDNFFDGEAVGGDGDPIYEYSTLRSNIDRNVVYANFDFEINDRLTFFVEGSVGSADTFSDQNSLATNYVCIQPDYAFIQPSQTGGSTELLDFVTANSGSFPCFGGGVPIRKDWRPQTNTFNETETDLTRFAFGFSGQFGDSTWTWDAYYQYGESDRTQLVNDNQHLSRGRFGIDAVIDPATGQPACRFDLPNINADPANGVVGGGERPFRVDGTAALANPLLAVGCVPINMLGVNTLTPEALDYGWGFLRENTVVEQEILEFAASGDISQGIGEAGPIRAAAGFSYRTESIANLAAEELPDYERLDFLIQYGESFGGKVDVTELFGEIDVPFTPTFGINAAYRHSQYDNTAGFGTGVEGASSSYDIDTYKVSANWDIIDTFRLRFSTSRDIRAPNFRELYYGQVFTAGGLFGFVNIERWVPGLNMDPAAWTLAGGLDVTPEEADTDTIGFVYTPRNANFRFAADWYQIEIRDAITPASIGLVLDQCFNRDAKACSQINAIPSALTDAGYGSREDTFLVPGDPLGGFNDVVTIRAEAFNFRSYNVEGVDITADYIHELANGTLSFRLIGSKTFEQIINPSTTDPNLTRNIAGVTGQTNGFLADWASAPDWTTNLTATYARGPFSLTGQMRYVAEGKNNSLWIGPDDPAYGEILRVGRFPATNQESVSNNRVPAYSLFNLSGTYNFELAGGNRLSLFGVVNNLFDRDPPLLGTGVGGTNPIFFDTIGRTYRLGLRMSFE
jgi:iron complex outermembrane recepter protein